ncbi:hypothetical protein GQ53DRAFT_847909 [Thozetella sp. PMI_491]|nr:hypothetical protein GQ53DRAFT_847909 [Thozetella sp. PMI_491]
MPPAAAATKAPNACKNCRVRKKKCDKVMPNCGYCVRKELKCGYLWPSYHAPPTVKSIRDVSPPRDANPSPDKPCPPASDALRGPRVPPAPTFYQTPLICDLSGIGAEVHRLIGLTGLYVDDITTRYFQTSHRHLPIISRRRFQRSIFALGAGHGSGPGPDVAVLLLVMCLITHGSCVDPQPRDGVKEAVDYRYLYLAAKSLLAQATVAVTPSVPLIQAGLLLAIHEYVQGRPEDAFVTITGCARMAHRAGLHTRSSELWQRPRGSTCDAAETDLWLQDEEAANTWWGIVVYERLLLCEMPSHQEPLITSFPHGEARLPVERDILDHTGNLDPGAIPSISMSSLSREQVGGFARAAQASCLLDQVIGSLGTADVNAKLLQLDGLDSALQAFLSLVFPQCCGEWGIFCPAISISLRAMFKLHWHILHLPAQRICAKLKSMDDWRKSSRAAMDTVTKMFLEVIELHRGLPAPLLAATPPSRAYIARAGLRHIYASEGWEDTPWLLSAEERLRAYVEKCRVNPGAT